MTVVKVLEDQLVARLIMSLELDGDGEINGYAALPNDKGYSVQVICGKWRYGYMVSERCKTDCVRAAMDFQRRHM